MSIRPGTYALGPSDGTLSVRTRRTGAAAKAGHDLLIHATAWQGTLEVGEEPAQITVGLDVDATSLRVQEGTGGIQSLDDDDRASILKSIDEDVLNRHDISFRSTEVRGDDGRITVQGDLTLVGKTHPITFELAIGEDGRISGSAVIKQTDWGIKQYSTLFGTLKVADDVEIGIDANLPAN